jgi:DNA-binding transcriptional MerR regulator
MAKSAEAFRTISEVADWLELPSHVLRFWESKFTQVKPVKRAGGRRYYRPNDMLLLGGIKKLLHDDGMTIKGAQKVLRESGVKEVSALSQPLDPEDAIESTAFEAKTTKPYDATQEAPFVEATPEEPTSEVISFAHHTAESQPVTSGPDTAEAERSTPNDTTETPPPSEPEPVAEDTQYVAASTEISSSEETAAESADEIPVDDIQMEKAEEPPLRSSPGGAAGLPSFLKPPAGPEAEAEEAASASTPTAKPASLAIDLPADPGDSDLDVDAGLLSRLAAFKSEASTETRRTLVQARADLKALSA